MSIDRQPIYRKEFKELAPKVWDHFGLDARGRKVAYDGFNREKAYCVRIYRALHNSLTQPLELS